MNGALLLHQTRHMTAWIPQEPGILPAPTSGAGVETQSLGGTRQALVTILTRTGQAPAAFIFKIRSFGLQDCEDSQRTYSPSLVTSPKAPAALRTWSLPLRRPELGPAEGGGSGAQWAGIQWGLWSSSGCFVCLLLSTRGVWQATVPERSVYLPSVPLPSGDWLWCAHVHT